MHVSPNSQQNLVKAMRLVEELLVDVRQDHSRFCEAHGQGPARRPT